MAKVSTLQISLLLATAALIQTANSLANFDSNDYYDNLDFDLDDDDGGGWWWNWNAESVTTQATSLETTMKTDSTTTPEIKTSDSTSEMQSTSVSTTAELQRTSVSTTPELQRTSASTTPELQRTSASTTLEMQRTSVTTTPEMQRTSVSTTSETQRTSVSTTPRTQRTSVSTTPETQRTSVSTTPETHRTSVSTTPETQRTSVSTTPETQRTSVSTTSETQRTRVSITSETQRTSVFTTPETQRTSPPSTTLEPYKTSEWPTIIEVGSGSTTELATSDHGDVRGISGSESAHTAQLALGVHAVTEGTSRHASGDVITAENTTLSETTFTDDIFIASTTTTATTTKDVTASSTYFPPTLETTSTKSEKLVSTRKTPKKALVNVFQESSSASLNLQLLNRNREDSALQTYLSTCSKCMVRQDPWSVCPLHIEAVTLQTWANQLSDILSHGCSLGSGNKGRCCVNSDATIAHLLREITHRIRDAYRELQDSCSRCPKDGGWSGWTAWASCSVTCGSGMRIRHRTCNNPPPGAGAENCEGPSRDSTLCFPGICCEPVDGQWTQWEAWSACSATCGDGTRQRIRTCRNPPPNHCGEKCLGEGVQTDVCRMEECCDPVSGHWSPWTLWSPCSVTCGSGSRERTRTCTNPRPNQCGSACPGSDREQIGCVEESCCLDGNWGDWAPWSTCSVSCGPGGVKERSRHCDSPAPNRCGKRCPGPRTESTECNCQPCCVDGSWGAWQPWSSCSKSCDRDGIQTRIRRCDDPPPNFCGLRCPGPTSDERPCIPHNPGPVDGNWGSWERWSQVTVTCGVGMRERRRRCDNPRPDACGLPCPGPSMERERYDTKIPCLPLCVDGSWGSWGTWGACPVTCGMAVRERRRACDSPRPNHCGRPCPGSSSQKTLQRCGPDPVDGNWGPWGAWGACPVTCGMAMRERRRACDFPPPNHCGRPCPGPTSQATLQRCGPDTVHGNWSPWGAWSACSVTCGGGRRHRTRTCSSPAPNGCGLRCPGADFDMQRCGTEECEVAEWGIWEPWCPCNCRKGVTSRRRYCLKGGKKVDSLIECQRGGGQAAEEKYCDVRQEKNCPECITDCAGKSNGMYPSCSGCSDYIICTNSRATVKRCHANYDWDAHKSECVPRPSESCSLKMPKTSCRGEADGLYHTNGGCHRYVECQGGRKTERRCSNKEQEFDAHLQRCRTGRSRTCVRPLAPHLQVVDWRLQQDAPAINAGKVDDATDERTQPKSGVSTEQKLGGKGVGKETKKNDSSWLTVDNDTLRRLRNTVGTTAEKSLDLENSKHLEENRIETSNNVEEVLEEAEHSEKEDDEKKIPTLNFDASGAEVEAEVKLRNGNPAHQVSNQNSSGAEAEMKLRNGNLTQRTTGPSPSTAKMAVSLQHDYPTQQTQNPRAEMKLDVRNDSRTQQTLSPKAEMELNPNLTHQNPIPIASGVETEIKLRNGDPGLQTQSQSSGGASGAEAEMALRNGDGARHTFNSKALESKAEVRPRTGSSRHLDVLFCRSRCLGLKKGKKYQSCQGCRFFLYCPRKGRGHVKRCHGKRVWDDVRRRCMKRSRTCKENANSVVLTEDETDSHRSVSKPRILTVSVKG